MKLIKFKEFLNEELDVKITPQDKNGGITDEEYSKLLEFIKNLNYKYTGDDSDDALNERIISELLFYIYNHHIDGNDGNYELDFRDIFNRRKSIAKSFKDEWMTEQDINKQKARNKFKI